MIKRRTKSIRAVISYVLSVTMIVSLLSGLQFTDVFADYGTNIAKGKSTQCSKLQSEWWMYDDKGNIKPDSLKAIQSSNAVDGDTNTSFCAYQDDEQWIYVDLGREYNIGRVLINWSWAAGKIYDIQVSKNANDWKTVYRCQKGYAFKKDNVEVYSENVRYVRVFIYRRLESYAGISELEVYEYKQGDKKVEPKVEPLPQKTVIKNKSGKGSYVTGDIYKEYTKTAPFIDEKNIKAPLDSNGWWTSAMINKFSSLLCVTPLKAKHSEKGLGILTGTAGWVGQRGVNDLATSQESENSIDFYILPEKYDSKSGYDKVFDYGDYSVDIGLCDESGEQMRTVFTQGNPYLFSKFCGNNTVYINSNTIKEVFDGKGNSILAAQNDIITTDHIGIKSVDNENTKSGNEAAYYCITVPEGTTFKTLKTGTDYSIEVKFPSGSNYMSVATIPNKSDIETYYQHGYAFVTDTSVNYDYNNNNSKVTTNYKVTTKLMRIGFSDKTMQCLFPHQWKHSQDANNAAFVYPTVRGKVKGIWKNEFQTTQQFLGVLPTFAKPDSSSFTKESCMKYLADLDDYSKNLSPNADAYWEGKHVHPLAMGVLMADQLGEIELRDKFLARLKKIMKDWLTYDGEGDNCYFEYNQEWGTIYYTGSAYGINTTINDHNFTYGYFVFGAVVLATYDSQFYNDYYDMVDLMIRDYANPDEPENDGNMFCKFRSFDPYAGHSWAGGFADSDAGNNQESSSEALFSWASMYMWGELTGNKKYMDAAAYGFSTEIEAVKQYWFDYDGDNWHKDYPFSAVGILYAGSAGYTTYFGGLPIYIYGIQWLPISEFLTYYGIEQDACAKAYAGLEYDTQYAIDIEKRKNPNYNPDSYTGPDKGWQHIMWPFLSQSDPARAISKFNAKAGDVQKEDRANTLWFITAMDQLGHKTKDYVVTGENITGSVYYNESRNKYTVQVWNPTNKSQTVNVINASGNSVGTAKIGSKALTQFTIDKQQFNISQVSTPEIKATGVESGTVYNGIVGSKEFEEAQYIELSCEDSGAVIHYTTDGSLPTEKSPVYKEKILVDEDTKIQAIATKSGQIDSTYATADIVIAGNSLSKDENIALGKKATASSENGDNTASRAVDGGTGTRWESKTTDNEYLQVDLGEVKNINKVKILWEAAYAQTYQIQVSTDNSNWTKVKEVQGNVGEVTTNFDIAKARYVRMQGVKRATGWGYSIFEFEVYEANQARAPKITPSTGVYFGAQTVDIMTSLKNAEIYYTLDGSTPTNKSSRYNAPIKVTKDTVVKAVSYVSGMLPSEVSEAKITISDKPVPTTVAPTTKNEPTSQQPTTKPEPATTKETVTPTTEPATTKPEFGYTFAAEDNTLLLPSENNLIRQAGVKVWASSERTGQEAEKAIDNLKDTRWQAQTEGNEWIVVDLGKECAMDKFMFIWENAQAKNYTVEISNDDKTYTTVATISDAVNVSKKRVDTIMLKKSVKARYVKLNATQTCAWGYAIFEMGVYGSDKIETTVEPTTLNVTTPQITTTENMDIKAPEGFAAELTDNNTMVRVMWKTYEGAATYNLYVDGKFFKAVMNGESIKVTEFSKGTHLLQLSVMTEKGESRLSNGVNITIPDMTTDITTTVAKDDISTSGNVTTVPNQNETSTTVNTITTVGQNDITTAGNSNSETTSGKPVTNSDKTVITKSPVENVVVPKVKIKKATKKKLSKKIKIKLKAIKGVSGYQIKISTSKKFKKAKTKKYKKATFTIKKLKANKKYYIRVRAYKVVNGTTYYGAWTKRKVKLKK